MAKIILKTQILREITTTSHYHNWEVNIYYRISFCSHTKNFNFTTHFTTTTNFSTNHYHYPPTMFSVPKTGVKKPFWPLLTCTKWPKSKVLMKFCTQFHQWGIKKQVPKDEYFCVHLGKDSTTLCRWFVLSIMCVLSVLCYINIKKRPVEQLEGVFFYCKTQFTLPDQTWNP